MKKYIFILSGIASIIIPQLSHAAILGSSLPTVWNAERASSTLLNTNQPYATTTVYIGWRGQMNNMMYGGNAFLFTGDFNNTVPFDCSPAHNLTAINQDVGSSGSWTDISASGLVQNTTSSFVYSCTDATIPAATSTLYVVQFGGQGGVSMLGDNSVHPAYCIADDLTEAEQCIDNVVPNPSCDFIPTVSVSIPATNIFDNFPYWKINTSPMPEGCSYRFTFNYRNFSIIQNNVNTDSFGVTITPETRNTTFSIFKQINLWSLYQGTTTKFDYNLLVQDQSNNYILQVVSSSFYLTATATSSIPAGYNPKLPCGGVCSEVTTPNGTASFLQPSSTQADLICNSTSSFNFWDINTWTCGIENLMNDIATSTANRTYIITRNSVSMITNSFLLSPIVTLNNDIALASQNTSTQSIILQSSSTFNGLPIVLYTSSTTSWIKDKAGFDYKDIFAKIMYVMTFAIIVASVIKTLKDMNANNQA
ncbi:MAG: hypothetical protein ACHQVK_00060 [Candidatus Paceibacterales bacterium]